MVDPRRCRQPARPACRPSVFPGQGAVDPRASVRAGVLSPDARLLPHRVTARVGGAGPRLRFARPLGMSCVADTGVVCREGGGADRVRVRTGSG